MAENFFSILKTECIHRVKPASLAEAKQLIDEYIWFYNNERIQTQNGRSAAGASLLRLIPLPATGGFCTGCTFWRGSLRWRGFSVCQRTGIFMQEGASNCTRSAQRSDKGAGNKASSITAQPAFSDSWQHT
jgi:hypothetical protein